MKKKHKRKKGYTSFNHAEKFHRITEVSPGGVWTFFILYRKYNKWGFLIPGKPKPHKVYYRNYKGIKKRAKLIKEYKIYEKNKK